MAKCISFSLVCPPYEHNLEQVQWCLDICKQRSFEIDLQRLEHNITQAAAKGSVHMVRTLFNFIDAIDSSYIFEVFFILKACEGGHIDIIEWARQHEDRFTWDFIGMTHIAIAYERYDVLLWLQRRDYITWDFDCLFIATKVHNLAILDWLLSRIGALDSSKYQQCLGWAKDSKDEAIISWYERHSFLQLSTKRKRPNDSDSVGYSTDSYDYDTY